MRSDLLGGVEDHVGPRTHFQAVTAVGCLQEEHILSDQAKHALDGSRDVLVEAIGKLDDDHRSISRGSHKASCDDPPAFAPQFAQDNVHGVEASTFPGVGKGFDRLRRMIVGIVPRSPYLVRSQRSAARNDTIM